MRVLKIHQMQMGLAVLFVILVVCFFSDGKENNSASGYVFNNQTWSIQLQGEKIKGEKLPDKVSGIQEIVLSRRIGEEGALRNSIGFYTVNQEVEAYIDRKLVYELKVPKLVKSKTTGRCWNFIEIPGGSEGKKLEIKLRNSYQRNSINIPQFYLGTKAVILLKEVRGHLHFFVISVILFVAGISVEIAWFALRKRMYLHRGMLWLGLFTIHVAVWSGMETQILQILVGRTILFGQIASMSLKLMACAAIRFIQSVSSLENSRVMNFFCFASITDFSISFLCQLFGWIDYEQTLLITQFIAIGAMGTAAVMTVKDLLKRIRKSQGNKKKMTVNVIGISIMMFCMMIDTFNYYCGFSDDMAASFRVGWLIYIILLGLQFIAESVKLIEAGKEVESIKEEAELDGLTRIKNRRCFEQDLMKICATEYKKYAIVVFDLNDLKTMNDLYGHGMGDCYIIISAEIIRDIFEKFGEVYRIGGDEFCLLSGVLNQEEYEKQEQKMCQWINSLKGSQVKEFMSIASGYAKFNKNIDMSLQDVMERADKGMYQRKKVLKSQ